MKNGTILSTRIVIALMFISAIFYTCKTNRMSQKASGSLSGKSDTVFFDEDWNECKRNEASYYRMIETDGADFVVKDMYLDHNPQMIAVCSSIDPLVKNGKCTFYEKNRIKSSEGTYTNDTRTGKWTFWEDNGKDSSIYEYRPDGTIQLIRIAEKLITENGILTMVDEMPQFPGGNVARMNFLRDNIIYPLSARKSGIQGTVYVTFVVEPDGSLTDARVLKGIGGGCDEEVIRIIKLMPKWEPGKQDGIPVRVQFNMPVKFTLTGKVPKK